MKRISVIIPVYSGENTLVPLAEKIDSVLSRRYSLELILVFDRGQDNSWNTIKILSERFEGKISGYRLARNYGQQRALMFGLSKATGDFIITMDEDLQHDPEQIPNLINAIESGGFDIVYGRFRNLMQPTSRKLFSRVLRKILVTFIPHLCNDYSPFRIIRESTVRKVIGMNGTITFIDDYLSRVTKNCGIVEIDHKPRPGGRSSYSLLGLLGLALSAIVAYTLIVPVLIVSGSILFFIPLVLEGTITAQYLFFLTGSISLTLGFAGLFSNRRNRRANGSRVEVLESTGVIHSAI